MSPLENYAKVETPTPGPRWRSLDAAQRREALAAEIEKLRLASRIELVESTEGGQVVIRVQGDLPVRERSDFLLDFEESLKKDLDEGLTVWLEPMGDRNSLRNLRGIKVK